MGGRQVIGRYWDEHVAWSDVAGTLKKRIERARLAALLLTIAVAVSGTTAGVVGTDRADGRVLAGAAAATAACVPLLQRVWAGSAVKSWVRARSVSEGLKSIVYLWLARAGDYEHDADGRHAQDRGEQILRDASDLLPYRQAVVLQPGELPPITDGRSYFAWRVEDQIDNYYRPKGQLIGRRLRQFRRVQMALALLAAVLGGIAAAWGWDPGLRQSRVSRGQDCCDWSVGSGGVMS